MLIRHGNLNGRNDVVWGLAGKLDSDIGLALCAGVESSRPCPLEVAAWWR